MSVKVKKNYGNCQIEIMLEGAKTKDKLLSASIFTMKDVCECGSEDISLTGHKAKGYSFVDRKCQKCGKVSGLGEYKDGGYYWKGWEAPFNKTEGSKNASNETSAPATSEDLNF